MMKYILSLVLVFISFSLFSQNNFNYGVQLKPIQVDNVPGLHSYAFAQHNGKWLIIGGRLDGIHARQPFNAFPQNQNNTNIFVIDPANNAFWSQQITSLSTGLQEQLQSTNMNFYQDDDSLYIVGGYAYSNSTADHITFPYLTSIDIPGLMNAIINSDPINSFFKQINDEIFAVTGGQLGKIDNTFYLVGGHRFDGRYNPMGNNTYTQTYTNAIQKFEIDNSGSQLSFSNHQVITDPVHLRRRDYNLVPQVFPDGTLGYTISSGVFQSGVDLPFLYPVDINSNGYFPQQIFNQYLSNYHCATVALNDSSSNEMHMLFFGGMSQYYYQNGQLIQDNGVPFVKTISRVTRYADSTLEEFKMSTEMPELKGSSAEFIENKNLPHYANNVIEISNMSNDTIVLGHIYGGIYSPSQHPFNNNNSGTTTADASIYEVRLIRGFVGINNPLDGENRYQFEVFPNPLVDKTINVNLNNMSKGRIYYYLTDASGKLILQNYWKNLPKGENKMKLIIPENISNQILNLTLVFENKFSVSKKVIVQ